MVQRQFQVQHNDTDLDVAYDTDHGFEVSPLFSLLNFLPLKLSEMKFFCRFSSSSFSLSPRSLLNNKRSGFWIHEDFSSLCVV